MRPVLVGYLRELGSWKQEILHSVDPFGGERPPQMTTTATSTRSPGSIEADGEAGRELPV